MSTGPAHLVLLRGLARGAGHWGDFAARCQAQWPQARIWTPELPGNGTRWQARSATQVARMTDSLRADLQAQGLHGQVTVIALSLGAMLACDWAQRHPQELAAVVLVNTSLRPFNPPWQRLRPAAWGTLLSAPWQSAARSEAQILALTSRLAPAPEAVLADWLQLRQQHPVRAANVARQLLAALRYRAPAQAPLVHMLVLSGAGDRLVNPVCSRTLAARWHLPHQQHPQAGHDLPLDDPDWLLAQTSQWLARLRGEFSPPTAAARG